jgi:hypothetical protein
MKLRAPGTCEHIWSAWRQVSEMESYRRTLWNITAPAMQWRECELCWGHQFAQGEQERLVWERAALAADLNGVRP